MSKLYCMHCGSPSSDLGAKFCARCGKPFLSTQASIGPLSSSPTLPVTAAKPAVKPPKSLDIEIIEGDDVQTNAGDLGFSVVEGFNAPVKENVVALAASPKTGFTRPKGKKTSKKQFLDDFKKESGTFRKS